MSQRDASANGSNEMGVPDATSTRAVIYARVSTDEER